MSRKEEVREFFLMIFWRFCKKILVLQKQNSWKHGISKTWEVRDRETRLFGAVSSRGKKWGVEVPSNNRHGLVRSLGLARRNRALSPWLSVIEVLAVWGLKQFFCVLFYSSYGLLSVYAYDSKSIASTTVSGFCRPPHYCAPLVCVPDVMGGLAGWQHHKPKIKRTEAMERKEPQ